MVDPLEVFITTACLGNKLIVSLFRIYFVSAVAGVCMLMKSQFGNIEFKSE